MLNPKERSVPPRERDEEKWVPVLRSSSRSQQMKEIAVHDFGLNQSKIIVI
jgi:hypothetical protein